jgi:hypothetical protein
VEDYYVWHRGNPGGNLADHQDDSAKLRQFPHTPADPQAEDLYREGKQTKKKGPENSRVPGHCSLVKH